MHGRFVATLAVLISAFAGFVTPVSGDLIPPGHRSVSHLLVFVDSPLLRSHRLVAMPTLGFGGSEEVQPNRPFPFSDKYGTRLYVVPDEAVLPNQVIASKPLPFPSCDIPVSATTHVPLHSSVHSLRTTCKLVAVTDDEIEVEVIEHVEFNSAAQPVTPINSVLPKLLISAVGLAGCGLLRRRTRRAKMPTTARSHPD